MTSIEAIRKRLEDGLYGSFSHAQFNVRWDETEGSTGFGVHHELDGTFVGSERYRDSWQPKLQADRLNEAEGPLIVDADEDIRFLLEAVDAKERSLDPSGSGSP